MQLEFDLVCPKLIELVADRELVLHALEKQFGVSADKVAVDLVIDFASLADAEALIEASADDVVVYPEIVQGMENFEFVAPIAFAFLAAAEKQMKASALYLVFVHETVLAQFFLCLVLCLALFLLIAVDHSELAAAEDNFGAFVVEIAFVLLPVAEEQLGVSADEIVVALEFAQVIEAMEYFELSVVWFELGRDFDHFLL